MFSNRGISLIEILIATTLFTGAVGSVLLAYFEIKKISQVEPIRATMMNIAREQLEILSDNITPDNWNSGYLSIEASEKKTVLLNDRNYEYYYQVSKVPGKDYRRVDMKVRLLR